MENKENDIELYSDSHRSTNENGDSERTVVWRDGSELHTETTVIHKNVPSVGTILLTAFVFTLIGALIAALIFFARFADIRSIKEALSKTSETTAQPTLEPIQTPAPRPEGNPSQPSMGGDNPVPELYSKNVSGVVVVSSYNGSARISNLVGTGTGFCISENGYIMTNAHVVEDANTYEVTTYGKKTVKATLVGSDVRTDIAVLKIDDASLLTKLELGDSDSVQTGEFVFAIGHPTGDELSFTATFGMVGAVDRSVVIEGVRNEYIQIDAAINPGNSGGPLFNMDGRVIGVNSAKTVIASYDENGDPINAEGLGFALPINLALDTARKIIDEGGIERPGIGISTILVGPETAEQYSIPEGSLVYSIIENGPGHLAGLKVDDIITAIDGNALTDNEVLGSYIRSKKVGDSVKLTVFRDGETLELTLVIGDLNKIGSTVLDNAYGGEKYGLR